MKIKQLLIEITDKNHRQLKARAAYWGVPMKVYVIDAIANFIGKEGNSNAKHYKDEK